MAKKKYKNSQRLEFRRLHFKIVKVTNITRARKILKSEFRRLYFKIFRVTNITSHDGQKNPKILKDSQNFAITAIISKIIFQNFQNYESHIS